MSHCSTLLTFEFSINKFNIQIQVDIFGDAENCNNRTKKDGPIRKIENSHSEAKLRGDLCVEILVFVILLN